MQKIGDHAVVLGAGIAGLLAARVVSDAYDRVTVIERDAIVDGTLARRGVPQGRHAHNLLPSGAGVIEELLPGLLDELEAGGAPVVRHWAELRFAPGGHLLDLSGRPTEPLIYQFSRPYLECHLRGRVSALDTVDIVDQCSAAGLVTTAAGDRVTGVRVRRGALGDSEQTLDADLVVDATGRGGRAAAWLATIGYDSPPEERLAIRLGYASRHLRLPAEALGGEKFVAIGAEPARPTGFVLFAQESDRWILTLIGYDGHHPPTDPEGFLAFVETAAPSDVFAAIRDADPVDDIVAHRFPANLRRRYDRLRRFPAGFLVFGDALCSSNPVYALGMSVAALQAKALRNSLHGGDRALAQRFFRAAAKPTGRAWQLAVGADMSLPQVAGRRPFPVRVVNAYVNRVLTAAEHDPAVAGQFIRVAALQEPSAGLLRPSTALRVLLGGRRHRPGPSRSTADGTVPR